MLDSIIDDDAIALLRRLVPMLEESPNKTDNTLAGKLRPLLGRNPFDVAAKEELAALFFTQKRTVRKQLVTKGLWKNVSAEERGCEDALEALKADLGRWMETCKRVEAARRLEAVLRFAADFLPRFERAKRQRGMLDFDDLVLKTRDLLASSPDAVSWVMFKLDGGIDHILVDEAQDTSPEQWQIISTLAGEFFVGEGREMPRSDTPFAPPARSLFVVGDRKQSIYSFQGADPAVFDTMRGEFARRLEDIGRPLGQTALRYSFRSAQPILEVVDAVAKLDGAAAALEPEVRHKAFQADLPGCVELWPRITPEENEGQPPSVESGDPVIMAETPERRLARRIVAFVKENVGRREIRGKKDGAFVTRPMRHGDILILVRSRGKVFNEVIAALKQADLPVAGVDRLKLAEELAVRDVLSLFRFIDLEEDDLSLAEALRSPLFGFSEADLHALAAHRSGTLWQALRARTRDEDAPEHWRRAVAVIEDLRARADFLRPHDLLQRLLALHGGRRRILGRLGAQGVEAIDALLEMTAAFEGAATPTLGRFLLWMEGEKVEIKRQLEGETDEIRVMTVHGAKGLESPVVILPDTVFDAGDLGKDEAILHFRAEEGAPVLPDVREADAPEEVHAAKLEAKRKRLEENWRLLYVAMTRAEQWLVVCGAEKKPSKDDGKKKASSFCDWHCRVEAALAALAGEGRAEPVTFCWGKEMGLGFRLVNEGWGGAMAETAAAGSAAPAFASVALPAWLDRPPSPAPERPAPINPSALGGEKVLSGAEEAAEGADEAEGGALYGTWLHKLLEHLADVSSGDRAVVARWLLDADPAPPAEEMQESLIADALRLLDDPVLAREVFRPEALAEVDLAGRLGGDAGLAGRPFRGTIDRLIVTDDEIVAIDFKTNAEVPATPDEIPEGILRQMGAYGRALADIWPDRPVRLRILWTRTGMLMDVPPELAAAAFSRACLDLPLSAA